MAGTRIIIFIPFLPGRWFADAAQTSKTGRSATRARKSRHIAMSTTPP
jgi:hypothetical protein